MKYLNQLQKLLCFTCVILSASPLSAQISYSGSGIVISYDAAGNRLVRKVQTICIGIGCPPTDGGAPGGKPSVKNDTLPDPIALEMNNNIISVKAYPNPTQELIYIRNEYWSQNDKAGINVYDAAGKKLINKPVSAATTEIYFKEFAPGTYLVEYILNGAYKESWQIIRK